MFDLRKRAALQHCVVLASFQSPTPTLEYAVLMTSDPDDPFPFMLARFFKETGGLDVVERCLTIDEAKLHLISKLAGVGLGTKTEPEPMPMAETDA